jgi:hypothetical protein
MRTYGIIGDLITFGVTVSTKHLHNPRQRDAIKPTLDNSLFHQKVVKFIPCIDQCSSLWISDPGSVGASDISPLISMVPKCVNEPSRSGSNISNRYFNSPERFRICNKLSHLGFSTCSLTNFQPKLTSKFPDIRSIAMCDIVTLKTLTSFTT